MWQEREPRRSVARVRASQEQEPRSQSLHVGAQEETRALVEWTFLLVPQCPRAPAKPPGYLTFKNKHLERRDDWKVGEEGKEVGGDSVRDQVQI